MIKARGEIELTGYEGGPHGLGRLALVTSDMAEAPDGTGVVMVVLPSTARVCIARATAPHLRDRQIIVLKRGGSEARSNSPTDSGQQGCQADVIVAETETLIYASRSDGPAEARISGIKNSVPVAALPATRTPLVLETLHTAYPPFINGLSALYTGLNNMGAICHPALTLLNAGRIESTGAISSSTLTA